MKKELICICCPNSCHLIVDTDKQEVTGNKCLRGKNYGLSEVTNPVRTLTSTVKVLNGRITRVSVKTDNPIPKGKLFEAMKEIEKISIKAPVTINQVLIKNIAGTESNLIATKNIEEIK